MFDYKKHILYAPDDALPTPVTTKEQYLYAKVTGGDTSNLPTPVTTEEQYLYALVQSGGGGGGSALTLYTDAEALAAFDPEESDPLLLYKDPALTQGWGSDDYDEEFLSATTVRVVPVYVEEGSEPEIAAEWHQVVRYFHQRVSILLVTEDSTLVLVPLVPAMSGEPDPAPFNPEPGR